MEAGVAPRPAPIVAADAKACDPVTGRTASTVGDAAPASDAAISLAAANPVDCPAAAAVALYPPGLDLDAWRGDLQRLHGTIDQVVQSFIGSQTRQLDAVAAELTSQRERILLKEQRFSELSDSIASFVEAEARRLELCGMALTDPEADARHEAYDAELPGPPVLHRINRLWRKATRAFDAQREASERHAASALDEQRRAFEARLAAVEEQRDQLRAEHAAELAAAQLSMDSLRGDGQEKAGVLAQLTTDAINLRQSLDFVRSDLAAKVRQLQEAEVAQGRAQYEWGVEREELVRVRDEAQQRVTELEGAVARAGERERELTKLCADRAAKLEDMRKVMDDQERELSQKIERVQQYVKERQAGALHAEKRQQDAERQAERWQGEVRRLQAEKDRLTKIVLDQEGQHSGQANELRHAYEQQKEEVGVLREALRRKEEEMRAANLELLQQRDNEYQAKVSAEKQKEKDRSIALLRKKEQEVHIKDQQLQAARRRIQELEGACNNAGNGTSLQSASPNASSRGSTAASGRRSGSVGAHGGNDTLPPLPLSAR